MFNGAAYFGISSPTYGTLTMGRQSALTSDLVTDYDPLGGANAWSVLTYQGANGGGGDTEDRVYDNSYEYRVNVGPVRFAVETQLRNGGNSGTGNAFEGDIGFDYMGLSMDFNGGKIYDAVSSGPLSVAQMGAITASGMGCSIGCVAGIVSDNTVFQVAAKYVIGPWKLLWWLGHRHFSNSNSPLVAGASSLAATTSVLPSTTTSPPTGFCRRSGLVRNTRSGQISMWLSLVPRTRTGSVIGNGSDPTGTCSTVASAGCSGRLDAVSLVAELALCQALRRLCRRPWSQVQNGLASGFLLANGLPEATGEQSVAFDPGVGLRSHSDDRMK